ncbi:MAG TPA: hypothetical protein VFM32_08670 [Spongiibacteraceae bacterium]|nr:hypothetical protein [Spongiibacteraceae bacterium]
MAGDAVSSLVKFCPIETGVKILSSQTLRWSAPHLFSDPFELDYESRPDVTSEGLLDVLLREALIMLFGPDVPTGRHNRFVNIMARWREQERFCDEAEAQVVLHELLGQIAQIHARQVEEYMREWRRFAHSARIACFSEKPHNVASWQRFADHHRGIALRFECGEGTGLPKPQRVTYQNIAPAVTTRQEQLEVIYGRRNAPTAAEFPEKLLIKGRHEHLEQEWRCFETAANTDEQDPSLWFDLRKFPAHELRAVYFGTLTKPADKELIIKLMRANYPTAKIYQAALVPGRYEIEFSSYSQR